MRIDHDGLLWISESELIALLVKLRDPSSGRGLDGAWDDRLFDPDNKNPYHAQNNDIRLRAESDKDAMDNTPDFCDPRPIIAGHHRGATHTVIRTLADLDASIREMIARPAL